MALYFEKSDLCTLLLSALHSHNSSNVSFNVPTLVFHFFTVLLVAMITKKWQKKLHFLSSQHPVEQWTCLSIDWTCLKHLNTKMLSLILQLILFIPYIRKVVGSCLIDDLWPSWSPSTHLTKFCKLQTNLQYDGFDPALIKATSEGSKLEKEKCIHGDCWILLKVFFKVIVLPHQDSFVEDDSCA